MAPAQPSRRTALALCSAPLTLAAGAARCDTSAPRGRGAHLADLPGFAADDVRAAFDTFVATARALVDGATSPRPATAPGAGLLRACRSALALAGRDDATIRRFFADNFDVVPLGTPAFFTGYYEPEVFGALQRSDAFATPLLGRPADLETFPPGERPLGPDLSAGRRDPSGGLVPYPARAAIEAGALQGATHPLVWLRDPIEAFMVHVQGSARVRLPDGRVLRLAYAGRNGRPYTSIGRILVTEGGLAPEEVDLAGLKAWVRAAGQAPDQPGGRLMARNASYIFFAIDVALGTETGPRGGAGVPLTPLRSIAVDRRIWAYGLPFWIEADLPGLPPLRRLMVAQDTGAAIVGRARFDLFVGSGDAAGAAAGGIRHPGAVSALVPHGDPSP